MQEVKGNLWDFHKKGEWICITTNGTVKNNGACVMGRGCALEAAKKWPDLAKQLGELIEKYGNVPFGIAPKRIITFPVKHNWYEKGGYWLIKESAQRIKTISELANLKRLYIPRPGCGYGHLDWKTVKPELEDIFNDDRFIIVSFPKEKP